MQPREDYDIFFGEVGAPLPVNLPDDGDQDDDEFDLATETVAELLGLDPRELEALDAEWDESEHPRDEDGKFTESGGGGSSGSGDDEPAVLVSGRKTTGSYTYLGEQSPGLYRFRDSRTGEVKVYTKLNKAPRGYIYLRYKGEPYSYLQKGEDYNPYHDAWNEEDHPREPAGSSEGGQFAAAAGGTSTVGATFKNGELRSKSGVLKAAATTAKADVDESGWSKEVLFHGGRELNIQASRGPLYLAPNALESKGFSQGLHLGGSTKGVPYVYALRFKPGKTVDIDDKLFEAMENGDDLDDVINREIEAARKTGARYVEFTHPGFSGEDFKAFVSIHPRDDLRIVRSVKSRLLKDAWNEEDHPRVPAGSSEGGQFTEAGGGSGGSSVASSGAQRVMLPHGTAVSKEFADAVYNKAVATARLFRFDADKIRLAPYENHEFELNGVKYKAAGTYHPDGEYITVWPNSMADRSVDDAVAAMPGIMVHEIKHHDYNLYRMAEESEKKAFDDLVNTKFKDAKWDRDFPMRADGTFNPPYDEQFPVMHAMAKLTMDAWASDRERGFLGQLADSDGVSDYSLDHWKAVKDGKSNSWLAVNETLAEMARIKFETGKLPEHMGHRLIGYRSYGEERPKDYDARVKRGQKLWRDLYALVDKAASKIRREQRAGKAVDWGYIQDMIEQATVQGKPATVAYMTKDFQPATAEAADMIKVIFDDGNVMFAFKDDKAPVKDYNPDPDFIQDPETGRFQGSRPGQGGGGGGESVPRKGSGRFATSLLTYRTKVLYPTLGEIEREKNLSPEDLKLQEASIAKFLKSPQDIIYQYRKIPDAEGGKIVSADIARRLFREEGYVGHNAAAVQEASSVIAKESWRKALRENPEPLAVLYAGGSGAGKSSAIRKTVPHIKDKAAVILDGNLSKYSTANQRVREAVAAGKTPRVIYVFRDYESAWKHGVIKRMLDNPLEAGRVVPLSEFMKNTAGSFETTKALYKDGWRVTAIDNTGGKDGAKRVAPKKFLEDMEHKIAKPGTPAWTAMREKLVQLTKEMLHTKGGRSITQEQYDALVR